MSTNPELTPEIIAELRADLVARRDHLRATIRALRASQGADHTETLDTRVDAPGEGADSSVELEEWDENHQEELDEEVQLGEIEHALSKIAAGTYGICEGCGRPIPLARLRALPEARFDIEHEQEQEKSRPASSG
jgi:DnaK suppressor protein